MTATNFDTCLALTLGYEGGFSDNPLDPGMATMCGITQAVYDVWSAKNGQQLQSVENSTADERAAIYRSRYWNLAACDQLMDGVDYAVFDFAVNSGVGRAVQTLQGIVNVDQDGQLGKYTLAAISRYVAQYTASALTDLICRRRMQFLQGLSTFATFGAGWTIRVMGHQDGPQSDDTGVIDRAFDMAKGVQFTSPASQVITPKTYNVTVASAA